jgi:8-oxo-dGTP pyrophosphatase MutT (NUDIX family)
VTYPEWLHPLVTAARRASSGALSRHTVPDGVEGRESAVLMLFGESEPAGPDVLLIERAHTLRNHAGQPAFPGGRIDPGDDGPVDAALREAAEETGLDPDGVDVLAVLSDLWLPPSGYVVTPVLGWWRSPSPVRVMDRAEVASVHRVPLADLVAPANRMRIRHPSGYIGPAFSVNGLTVWGFTAGILSALLDAAGLAKPWDSSRVEPLPMTTGASRL